MTGEATSAGVLILNDFYHFRLGFAATQAFNFGKKSRLTPISTNSRNVFTFFWSFVMYSVSMYSLAYRPTGVLAVERAQMTTALFFSSSKRSLMTGVKPRKRGSMLLKYVFQAAASWMAAPRETISHVSLARCARGIGIAYAAGPGVGNQDRSSE
jgi:hypothetical protein